MVSTASSTVQLLQSLAEPLASPTSLSEVALRALLELRRECHSPESARTYRLDSGARWRPRPLEEDRSYPAPGTPVRRGWDSPTLAQPLRTADFGAKEAGIIASVGMESQPKNLTISIKSLNTFKNSQEHHSL